MNAVGLVERRIGHDAVQKKRIKSDAVLFGEAGINGVKFGAVFPAQIWRRQHTGEQHPNLGGLQPGDDVIKIFACFLGVQRPQPVVGAKLDDGRMRLVAQRSSQSGTPTRRGIAGDTRIDDRDLVAPCTQRDLQHIRKRLTLRQSVSGTEAVAQHHQPNRIGSICRSGDRQ